MAKKNDGRWLETLVEMAERHAESVGAKIERNKKIFDEDGDNIAELDIVVTRQEGDREFKWLIECRDRRSNGKEGVSWIEQLSTRKRRLNLDKVSAVSSSGFSRTAKKLAKAEAIEVREVHSLTSDAFDDWLEMKYLAHQETSYRLDHATIFLRNEAGHDLNIEVKKILASAEQDARLFRHSESGDRVRVCDAFSAAVMEVKEVQSALKSNAPPISVRLDVTYPQDKGHYIVDTDIGPAAVSRVLYFGGVSRSEIRIPLERASEYRGIDQRVVSRVAAFKDMEILGVRYALELHRLGKTDETFVILRRTGPYLRKQSAKRLSGK